jgi:hypothetical protein
MYFRPVSLTKAPDHRLWRQYRDCPLTWPMLLFQIALGRPQKQRVTPDEIAGTVNLNEAAIRQLVQ